MLSRKESNTLVANIIAACRRKRGGAYGDIRERLFLLDFGRDWTALSGLPYTKYHPHPVVYFHTCCRACVLARSKEKQKISSSGLAQQRRTCSIMPTGPNSGRWMSRRLAVDRFFHRFVRQMGVNLRRLRGSVTELFLRFVQIVAQVVIGGKRVPQLMHG